MQRSAERIGVQAPRHLVDELGTEELGLEVDDLIQERLQIRPILRNSGLACAWPRVAEIA
jgi:hypothetical protein